MRQSQTLDILRDACVGTTTPVLGVITSMQEQIEWGLRVASLVVGLLVGLLSIVSIIRKLRRS
jgi:hypothetical protein